MTSWKICRSIGTYSRHHKSYVHDFFSHSFPSSSRSRLRLIFLHLFFLTSVNFFFRIFCTFFRCCWRFVGAQKVFYLLFSRLGSRKMCADYSSKKLDAHRFGSGCGRNFLFFSMKISKSNITGTYSLSLSRFPFIPPFRRNEQIYLFETSLRTVAHTLQINE